MVKSDRTSNFRAALWTLTTKVIPQASPILQPSLLNIAQLLGGYLLTPEESDKLFHKIQAIWYNQPLEIDPRIDLLTYYAWKLRLYLTFGQIETAFQFFRQLISIIKQKDPSSEDLEDLCLPYSGSFPFPSIPEEYIEMFNTVAQVCQKDRGSVTIKNLAEMVSWSQQKVISFLKELEINFGCLFATESLGLYYIRAEIEIDSVRTVPKLLTKFQPFAIKCEVHSPSTFTEFIYSSNFITQRFSAEFFYPIDQKHNLFIWAKRNGVKLYRQVEHHIYHNSNVFYKEPWHVKESTRLKADAWQTTVLNMGNKIKLTKESLQIIETYLKPVAFSRVEIPGAIDQLIPFSDVGIHLGLREDWARQEVSNLFNQGILVRYFYSSLLGFTPDKLIEGAELNLHIEARQYLYTRLEALQALDEDDKIPKTKIYRLYTPETSQNILQREGFRGVKRVYWQPPPLSLLDKYDFKQDSWISPTLPEIQENN